MDPEQLEQKILRAVRRRPHTAGELQNNLQVPGGQLRAALARLAAAGAILLQDGQYRPGPGPADPATPAAAPTAQAVGDLIPCVLVKLAPRFGFAARQDGSGEIFIPGRLLQGAMPQDGLLVRLLPQTGPAAADAKAEGEVAAVTAPRDRFAGTVVLDAARCPAIEPDGCPGVTIALQPGAAALGGAQVGDKVGAQLVARGTRHADHRATVTECYGPAASAAACVSALLYGQGIRQAFPPAVLAEAAALPTAVDAGQALATGHRVDLRGIPIFTIDSAATRDIDDAISVQALAGGGFELGVHIADVSHYVGPGTALDAEALARATSLYYADRVIPMLPPELSNGICSLNEGEDRLAFSCLMQLDSAGELRRYRFVKSVIRSRVKGVYSEVDRLLAGSTDAVLCAKYAAVAGQLPAMQALFQKRLALRRARGGMELGSSEAKLVLDENGRCIDVVKQQRGTAAAIIEEFMLLANQCAGNAGRSHGVPFVYRVHEPPDPLKLERLCTVLHACGMQVPFAGAVPTQPELAALLESTRGQPVEAVVHTAVLRSLQKARYAPQPLGHYGLALADYAHFTSPIRRYPDLAVHRILTDLLLAAPHRRLVENYTAFAAAASAQSTRQETVATQLERTVTDLYKAEYLHAHLGETYTGTVSGVTPHGVFVQLPNTVEGFVPAAQLCRGEAQVQDGVRLYDSFTGKAWRLGDAMRVRAAGADVALGHIDFDYLPDGTAD